MPRKHTLATCALAAACIPGGAALAQSSVTLFGVADAAIRHVSADGAGSQTSLTSGGNTTSRIGFKGVEDLGGGLRAGFHLEGGVQIDEGTVGSNNMFFDRRTTVSLMGPFGEVRIGRDRVLTHVWFSDLEPFNYTGMAKASNLQAAGSTNVGPVRSAMGATPSGLNGLTRSNNMVQYYSPKLAGFEISGMYQFREGGTAVNGFHKSAGLRVKYESGPVRVGIGQQRISNDITGAKSLTDTVIGGAYDFKWAEIAAAARRWSYDTSRQTNYMLGATVPLRGGELKLSWIKADLDGRVGTTNVSANDAVQLGVGYEYPLSKRTSLYGVYAHIKNKGRAAFTVGLPVTPGGRSSGYDIGLVHKF